MKSLTPRLKYMIVVLGLCCVAWLGVLLTGGTKLAKWPTTRDELLNRITNIELSLFRIQNIQKESAVLVNITREMGQSDDPVVDGIIDPRKFRYAINTPRDMCKKANFSMFIYIHSAATNFQRRQVLRETWANKGYLKSLNVGYVFITGIVPNNTVAMDRSTIKEESRRYGDIVQTAYRDTYLNITLKSTCSLNWAATYCAPYVPVILKSDDDIFINVRRLMRYIHIDLPKIKSAYGDKLILCNMWTNESVVRDDRGRYYIPNELYSKKLYPPFCQGSALIMTPRAAINIQKALIGARFYPLDDVLLTGFLAPLAGVTLVPINGRHLKTLKQRNVTHADLKSNFLFVHTSMPNLMVLWKHM